MRRVITGVALAALTFAMLVPGSPAHAATTGPTLAVDTPGLLEDQQPVTMTGAGLTPGETPEPHGVPARRANLCTYCSTVSGTVDPSRTTSRSPRPPIATSTTTWTSSLASTARTDDCGFALVAKRRLRGRLPGGGRDDRRVVRGDSRGRGHGRRSKRPAPLPAVVSTRRHRARVHARGAPSARVVASLPPTLPDDDEIRATSQDSATADARGDVAVPIELRARHVPRYRRRLRRCRSGVCSVRLDGPEYRRRPAVAGVRSPPAPTTGADDHGDHRNRCATSRRR